MRSYRRDSAGLRLGDVPHPTATVRRTRWLPVIAVAGALATSFGPLNAQAQEAAEATAVSAEREYSIPAGSLADALHQFSEQSGIQVFFETEMVAGETVPALNETLMPEEAIARLLSGSGLIYEYVNDNTLILKRPGSAAGQRRPGIEEIIVTGLRV
jgi:hypothetical protein